ncbi:helix-turn-helix domain-containing protein [Dietzia timorensis]|uniref:helix-turn-helix domain-containing protein n=1 Tax=Dietzia timorensis TaxID=499555 RepID=UPI00096A9A1E|nr:helix-turn-helix transcriptional regulator [Dietzia timorensis]
MATDRQRGNEVGRVARTLGENVAQRRADLGISARELAERLTDQGRRFTLSSVQKIERAERRVDVDDLRAIADALGVTPNDLLAPGMARGNTSSRTVLRLGTSVPGLSRAVSWAARHTNYTEDELLDHVSALFRLVPHVDKFEREYQEWLDKLANTSDPREAAQMCRDEQLTDLDLLNHADELLPGRPEFAALVRKELGLGSDA